ncbi:hypothetical protein IQ247_20750 [Plectonema cf. radiosum LEGE 06105]|uniref:Uncharacterized protein n=1 Tax=Plectonema cf. radiosum LEGE 06105 TaxID=945769 RepID=A0A8J7FEL6_9CYAN|nr:hypothetical protein [Plectonema radiosum]MBE9215063.1 hypothetical protein [Plectonema cf. radiosum LEGE 06105]
MTTTQAFLKKNYSLTNTAASANQLVGRGFAVQNKLDNNQTDLKTQLKQATHFGHNLDRIKLEQTQSAKDQNNQNSSVIQQKKTRANTSRYRAETTAINSDQPLEPISNQEKQAGVKRSTQGHGNQRHGHQRTDADLVNRLQTEPKTTKSSRFTSPQAQAEALGRGHRALNQALKQGNVEFQTSGFVNPKTGQPARHAVEVSTNRKNGFGVQAEKIKQKDPKTGQNIKDPNTKKPVTKIQMNSQPLNKAKIVYEYVPSAKTWRPLTYFPI